MIKVKCPYCGYEMPLVILPEAVCRGVTARCKNKKCRKAFEIKVNSGRQELPQRSR